MLKHPTIATFAAVVLLSLAALPATSQALYRRVQPGKSDKGQQQVLSDELRRMDDDPNTAAERDRMDTQMNRELLDMRRNMMQEAMNRMNQARFGVDRGDWQRFIADFIGFAVFVIILSAVLWLVRTILENRRWNKIAAIQTDVHTKLMEKMSSSEELLAYMESEAGKRFLKSSPFELDHEVRPRLPFGRILLPAQAGVVILMGGAALIWLEDRLPDAAQGLLIFGSLGMALGIGLVLSAALAYSLSKHMGLDKQQ